MPDGSDDIASVDIPFVRVVAGTYLVRAQVNGAESLLAPDGTGAFATPRVVVRMSAAIDPATAVSLVAMPTSATWSRTSIVCAALLEGSPDSGVGGRRRSPTSVRARPPGGRRSG